MATILRIVNGIRETMENQSDLQIMDSPWWDEPADIMIVHGLTDRQGIIMGITIRVTGYKSNAIGIWHENGFFTGSPNPVINGIDLTPIQNMYPEQGMEAYITAVQKIQSLEELLMDVSL